MRRALPAVAALATCLLGCAAAPPQVPDANRPDSASGAAAAGRTRGLVVATAARSPALADPSAMDRADALRQPFDAPLPATLRSAQGQKQRVMLAHCADLLAQRDSLVGSDSDAQWRVLRLQQVECEVLALAQRSRPAASTALPQGVTAGTPEFSPGRMPASLWPAPSADERAELARPGQTLASATAALAWSAGREAGVLELDAHGMRLRLTLRLRADVDGDHWEDLVFALEAQALRGSYADSRTVVLVRPRADAPLREIDVAALLRRP